MNKVLGKLIAGVAAVGRGFSSIASGLSSTLGKVKSAWDMGWDAYFEACNSAWETTWNSRPVLAARNLGNWMIADRRPTLDPNAATAKKEPVKASAMLAPGRDPMKGEDLAERMKGDPEAVIAYANASNKDERDKIANRMSPKARDWVQSLDAFDLISLKERTPAAVAQHLTGVKPILGVAPLSNYGLPIEDVKPTFLGKTVAQRSQERREAKAEKRDRANGIDPMPRPEGHEVASKLIASMNETRTPKEQIRDRRAAASKTNDNSNSPSASSPFTFRPPARMMGMAM